MADLRAEGPLLIPYGPATEHLEGPLYVENATERGFGENFDPLTGASLRDPAYTWTTSVYLALAHRLLDGPGGAVGPALGPPAVAGGSYDRRSHAVGGPRGVAGAAALVRRRLPVAEHPLGDARCPAV